jgi:hypothetical protein
MEHPMVDGGYPDGCYITVVNISYFEFRAYEQVSCFVTVLLCVASVTALTPGRAPENGGDETKLEHGLVERTIFSFVLQEVVSTIGAVLTGVAVMLVVALISAVVTPNTSNGDFIDHVVDQPFFTWADRSNLVYVIAGFVLGGVSFRFFRTKSAAWVWVLPSVVLVWNIFTWKNGGYLPYWPDVWNNYFSSGAGLYQLLVTVPFYTSVAYSLGWLAVRLSRRRAG